MFKSENQPDNDSRGSKTLCYVVYSTENQKKEVYIYSADYAQYEFDRYLLIFLYFNQYHGQVIGDYSICCNEYCAITRNVSRTLSGFDCFL